MYKAISCESHYNSGQEILTLKKKKGKFKLEEIEEFLCFGDGGNFQGHYILILNCTESTCGGQCSPFEQEPTGDAVRLTRVHDSDTCPICTQMLPPMDYCPKCGEAWKMVLEGEQCL